jgi:cytochrome c oxidase subunit 1
MVIFAMPAVMIGSSLLSMDRLTNVSTHFFNQAEGGDPIMWQHLFWFFGHPEVYIIFIPATGMVSMIITTFSRRKTFGYTALVLTMVATAFIGFGVWVHHMFVTPLPQLGQSIFTASSMLIVVPNGVQIFCWLATLWLGRWNLKTPLVFILGFFGVFVMGGLTGVMLASLPLDTQLHDTYFVVAHFHYVLIGGAVFPLFGAVYYWFPKILRANAERGGGDRTLYFIFRWVRVGLFPDAHSWPDRYAATRLYLSAGNWLGRPQHAGIDRGGRHGNRYPDIFHKRDL